METKTEKAAYSMAYCIRYMLRTAWRTSKAVPILQIVIALLAVGESVAQLFIAPMILQNVEMGVPVETLLGTILGFTALLMALTAIKTYADQNVSLPMVDVRSGVIREIGDKSTSTSYANVIDPAFQRLMHNAVRSTGGNDGAVENVWRTMKDLLQNLLGFGIYLILLQAVDPILLAIVLLTTAVSFAFSHRLHDWEEKHREEAEQQYTRCDYLRNKAPVVAKDVRIFGLLDWITDMQQKAYNLQRAYNMHVVNRRVLAAGIDAILTVLRLGAAYWYLLTMAISGGLSASEFLLYFTAVTGLAGWITGILDKFETLRRECRDISRVQEFLHYPEPFRFSGGKPILSDKGCAFTLEHVSYRYPGAEEDTIHDIDLEIRAGEKIAVVGLNGAGKTTLVRLLAGFVDPTEGRVLLNGTDIREFDRAEYYKLFSSVFQEYSELYATVAQNVSSRLEDFDRERVANCLEQAGLTKMVSSLPQGMDTQVGRKIYFDGTLFSGGETQRLMLARALYKDGAVLLLDEPTAALDPLAESDLYQKYSEMTAGKTSVFISHRLASTRFCDRILFLEDGKITEEGTHESLLEKGGGYAALFEVQSRYYREGREF